MALMTAACALAAFAPLWPDASKVIPAALTLVVAGCLLTVFRRCRKIAQIMEAK